MRYSVLAVALLAGTASAQGIATPTWQYYQDATATKGMVQAFVQATNGSQLILKCDAPGKQSVYAAMVTTTEIAPPGERYQVLDVDLMFDGGSPVDTRWRFYPRTAMAVHTARDKALPRFLEDLVDAKSVEIRLFPFELPPVTAVFRVEGAREAIAQVFESCKDENDYTGS